MQRNESIEVHEGEASNGIIFHADEKCSSPPEPPPRSFANPA